MGMRIDQKIVLVTRRTRLQELVDRFNTKSHARFYVSRMREIDAVRSSSASATRAAKSPRTPADGDFSDYEREDDTYRRVLDALRKSLSDFGLPVQIVDRSFLPNFVFGPSDIVVTLGQDGLVANTAKYALEQPIVAVNPEPARFDGILMPFVPTEAPSAVRAALERRARTHAVTLAQVTLSDQQTLLAFNDFFLGTRTHTSARYRIELAGQSEPHSSSGILVSTGAGSTGWLSSTFNMAAAITRAFTPEAAAPPAPLRMTWEDPRLVFIVREPFLSRTSRATLGAGIIEPPHELIVESLMPTDGVIFSDGIESDFLQFNAGTTARIHAAPQHARLVVKK